MRPGKRHESRKRPPRGAAWGGRRGLLITDLGQGLRRRSGRLGCVAGKSLLFPGHPGAVGALVEGVFQGMHPLGTSRGEQPAGDDAALLGEFNAADGIPQPHVEPRRRIEWP